MGKALRGSRRDKVFLMTKGCGRTYEDARAHLDDSLRRFNVEAIDLWQFHGVKWDTDPRLIFVLEDGSMRAAMARRYALSLPITSLVCRIQTREELRHDIARADDFVPLSPDERAELLRISEPFARDGHIEGYKVGDSGCNFHIEMNGGGGQAQRRPGERGRTVTSLTVLPPGDFRRVSGTPER